MKARIIRGIICLLVSAGVLAGSWFWSYVVTGSVGTGSTVVLVRQGAGVREIGQQLAEKGLLKDDLRYLLLVYFSGLSKKLRAGEYDIAYGLTPSEVLTHLASGKVVQHAVTVPEGLSIEQTAEIFAGKGWAEKDRFVECARDKMLAMSLGLEVDSLEGYLFPDTYFLTRGKVEERFLITMMVSRFFQVTENFHLDTHNKFSCHELVTLASIVEKETGSPEERPVIARVFFNRLARRMRLQSDPTVIYGLEHFNGTLTRADLRNPTPYNTYTIAALPPGPICNPGKESLKAVLHPADSGALYFVSRNDGTHVFSTVLREHNRAVKKYQKTRNRENK